MSYDVSLTIDTGGEYPAVVCEVGNITSNVMPMIKEAMGFPFRELDGVKAFDAQPKIDSALARMEQTPETFKAMNPPNGWGSYEGTMGFLARFSSCCVHHPQAVISMHY